MITTGICYGCLAIEASMDLSKLVKTLQGTNEESLVDKADNE